MNEGFRTKDARIIRQDIIKGLNLSSLNVSGIRALSTYGEESFTIFTEDGGELIVNVKILPHIDGETMKKRISVEMPPRGLTGEVKQLSHDILEWAKDYDNIKARFRQYETEPPEEKVRIHNEVSDMTNKSEQLMSLIHARQTDIDEMDTDPVKITMEYEDGMIIESEFDDETGDVLHVVHNPDATMECYFEDDSGISEIECDRVGDYYGESLEEMSEVKFKRVIRGGQKVKKIICGPGKKVVDGRCVMQSAQEKQHRKAAIRKSRGKRRLAAKKVSTLRKRKKSLNKRSKLGLKAGKY